MLLVVGLLLVVFIVSLSLRRHGEASAPSEDWKRTDEVFRDPSTGRLMRVWLDAAGERHYVPDGGTLPG
ncbi:MAG: hypothetical protein ACXVQ0_12005 [Actinomycetota bacterium]